jgi:hypothetical protein
MRSGVLFTVALIFLVGCSSSSPDEGTIKPGDGVAQNPSGKPRTPEEAAMAQRMSQAGDAMNAARAAEAKARAEAMAKAGANK